MAKPIHSFSTQEALPTIEIDGEAYPFRLDVDYQEILDLQEIARQLRDITEKPQRTEEDNVQIPQLLEATTERMVKLPTEVSNKLTVLQRLQISMIFNDLVEERVQNPTKNGRGISRG